MHEIAEGLGLPGLHDMQMDTGAGVTVSASLLCEVRTPSG